MPGPGIALARMRAYYGPRLRRMAGALLGRGGGRGDAEAVRVDVGLHVRVTVQNRFGAIAAALQEAAAEAVAQTAEELVADARARAPVKTGRLRDSIAIVEQTDQRAVVEVAAPYAALVEFGGVSRTATPFWTPATELARRNLEKNLAAAFRRRLGRTR